MKRANIRLYDINRFTLKVCKDSIELVQLYSLTCHHHQRTSHLHHNRDSLTLQFKRCFVTSQRHIYSLWKRALVELEDAIVRGVQVVAGALKLYE
jgi:hypothetical protein